MTRRRTANDILNGLDADRRLAILHNDDQSAAQGWEADPTPLTPRRLAPPFPVDALPTWVADMVMAVAEFTQTPLDLPGCLALAALSTAAGGRAEIEIRPGWREPLNLYTVVAMPPGSRKSAVFAAMTAPLLEAEGQLIDQARPRIAEAELARKMAAKEAERRTIEATNVRDPAARAEALNAAAEYTLEAEKPVPALPRLIADDVTTEAAASLLAEQRGRLAVLSAEGGIFSTIAGRYSSGVPNLETFLKGHSGDLLRVDRKGRPAEHVESPALTLGLALQPEVLQGIARMPGFRGRGLLARILYSLPENIVGRRQVGAPAVPAPIDKTYASRLTRLVMLLADHDETQRLRLSREADREVLDLERRLEPRLAPHADLAHMTDWASKLNGAIARLAGLLFLSDVLPTGWGEPIPTRHLDAAARLGHYFLGHALAVFDQMAADPTVEDARTVLEWINRVGAQRFSRRDAFSGLSRARFRKVTDLEAPLTLLEAHDFIRRGPVPAPTGGRPSSPMWEVHPRAAKAAQAAEARS
ncbi:YfjI family protein [Pseudonocardia xishanensis]|uniref:YfjI family protein n=1 Tax=Pseudonocardia xishanensis TaxID=630995 RepID=A0ABP8RY82_9PSEU